MFIPDVNTLKVVMRNGTTEMASLTFQRPNNKLMVNEWIFFTLVINRKNSSIDVYLNGDYLSKDFPVNGLAITWTWLIIGSYYTQVSCHDNEISSMFLLMFG